MDTTAAAPGQLLDTALDAAMDLVGAANRAADAVLPVLMLALPDGREQVRAVLLALDELAAAQDQVLAAVGQLDE